mgnify:CR=1 FL=1
MLFVARTYSMDDVLALVNVSRFRVARSTYRQIAIILDILFAQNFDFVSTFLYDGQGNSTTVMQLRVGAIQYVVHVLFNDIILHNLNREVVVDND